MSMGTMKNRIREFTRTTYESKGKGSTKPSGLKEIIPIRRGPWENPAPGFGEVDTVAHCGHTLVGDFAYTVQYTDIATLWTLLAAQWNKGQESTKTSIEGMKERLPFPLRGLDPDSGSEFINWCLKGWCDAQDPIIAMTRARPYRKNDHARIEQKNYTNVRQFVGYVRIDDRELVTLLQQLYLILEDYINFFLPSMKCIEKTRVGSTYMRKYDKSRTAYRRVLDHEGIAETVKARLRQRYATLNPKALKEKADRLTRRIMAAISRKRKTDYGNT
jgi:uncharacterized protein (UPF0297 family)